MLKKANPWQILLSTSAGGCMVTVHKTDQMKQSKSDKKAYELSNAHSRLQVKLETKYLENVSGFVQIKYVHNMPYSNFSTC